MAGLSELTVSLTKNGYYKVAEVIKRHSRHEVLDNISGVHEGINLNRAQIANMLSADPSTDELPEEWDDIRAFGDRAIESFTFIAILFSHENLIVSFANASTGEMRGVITRGLTTNGTKLYAKRPNG